MRARNKRPVRSWKVTINGTTFRFFAKTLGHAARQAFRNAIALGRLKRQPRADGDGGWHGVAFECEPEA